MQWFQPPQKDIFRRRKGQGVPRLWSGGHQYPVNFIQKTESDVSSRPEAKLGNGLLLWLSLIRSLKLNLFQGFISKRSKIPEQEVMQVQFFVYSMPSKTC
ncbi:Hypothetical predicted protein [Podarcis lilfordi]|uniref:Uncharacterized protein n=1 Tax=Podarcis lilfordi TaxID=74358 RepID=A0AA35KDT7_9SAUR|nr:Hypothetical predicted protein [Podarcis lilfordi]